MYCYICNTEKSLFDFYESDPRNCKSCKNSVEKSLKRIENLEYQTPDLNHITKEKQSLQGHRSQENLERKEKPKSGRIKTYQRLRITMKTKPKI